MNIIKGCKHKFNFNFFTDIFQSHNSIMINNIYIKENELY